MLTAAQREARAGKLTSSVVAPLMRGDAEAIMRLYRIMIGEEQEDDLRRNWNVRRGEATEQLQCDWFEERNRVPVTRRGEVVVHPLNDCFAATLDGWVDDPGMPFEAKDVLGNEPLEVVIERYMPQMHFAMCCSNSQQCALSVIIAGREPVVDYIQKDDDYANELLGRALQFMDCVRRRIPPVHLNLLPAPLPVSKFIDYNMTGNGVWRDHAARWIQTEGAAKTAQECEKVLKSLVPEDAKKCFGDGVRITRDRAGRLSLRRDA